ncbi:hypothetical protein [Megalodesulfovibrio paquesii]
MTCYRKALHVQTMQPWYMLQERFDPTMLEYHLGLAPWIGWDASEYGGIERFTDEEVAELFTFEEEAPPALRHLFEAMPSFHEWRGLCRVSGLAS